ncbi:response regulator [Paractinoplanes durhamensis]|uniref:DNA-binding response regulator n=1 Tax=Paractinoplanes durhamensis TaxID=113563 RepID=A0ABQ3Z5P7_9ACTN|nr:response regulator transcription factor [Actinoplanes durhamensis]GIE05116.1 DNA-binding response regulator [Actinoplanes durhamensis]
MLTRVLVADDHPLVRAGLSALLAAHPGITVVAEVAAGEDIVRTTAANQPDVVLMELNMPGCDGLDVIAEIVADNRRYAPARPVRVLAMTDEWDLLRAYAALRAGASGLLLKTRPPDVVLGALRAVTLDGTWLDPAVVHDMLTELASRPVTGESAWVIMERLTAREREVLVLLAHGLGNHEIAARLVVSEATVRTHVGRILMKLDCRDRTKAVVVAYRSGLVRVPAGVAA